MASSKNRRRDWYSVSVDSLRAWATFFFVVAALVVGYFVFSAWEAAVIKGDAQAAIDGARTLAQQLETREGLASFRKEYASALDHLKQAQGHYRAAEYAEALEGASTSRNLLDWILDALSQRDPVSEAQFISVQGGVYFRRGEGSDWQPARNRISLAHGDYVRTSTNGSAEIMFANGTLYTVRPETLFIISRSRAGGGADPEQSIKMEYGWVNLNTKTRESSVATPEAEAWVQRNSAASVSYDRGSGTGRFVTYQGRLRVHAKGGLERQVAALEQVVQVRDLLSPAKALPPQPDLFTPSDNFQVRFGKASRLDLSWQGVRGASRYALQVSRSDLFVDNIIDTTDRTRNQATLGLRGEGTFLWRVAAISSDGVQGPWSEPRKFRVASFRGGAEADTTPPRLEVQDIKSYGSIFILGGTTEPGAEVEINGEPVTVAADGTFTKTIQLFQEGWSFLTIRARDAWGNEVERRQRVFVEAF